MIHTTSISFSLWADPVSMRNDFDCIGVVICPNRLFLNALCFMFLVALSILGIGIFGVMLSAMWTISYIGAGDTRLIASFDRALRANTTRHISVAVTKT